MTDNAFKARDIGLRAQKKILSRMATKSIAKTFIDGTTASLLDNVYRLAKIHVSFKYEFCLMLKCSAHVNRVSLCHRSIALISVRSIYLIN